MTFKTKDELITYSTATFVDNASGLITPSGFRGMHEHIADSMVPYDSSGVFQINTTPTGSVPTPTPTGACVFDGTNLYIFGGTWKTFTPS